MLDDPLLGAAVANGSDGPTVQPHDGTQIQASVRRAVAPACIAWWNTGLSPPKKSGSSPPSNSSSLMLAAEVVSEVLVDKMTIDILALGEVSDTDLAAILRGNGDAARYGRVWYRDRNLAVIYDTTRVAVVSTQEITAHSFGQRIDVGLWLETKIDDALLALAAVHWPSRVVPQGANARMACGRVLQDRYQQSRTDDKHLPVLIIGDFNDEPFNDSLTMHLQGTRDRTAALRNDTLLYNPFWRLLGQNRASGPDDLTSCAGSHFWKAHPSTDWYTVDQALVSSSLLRGTGWTLLESETSIVAIERLRTPSRNFRLGFDHLPIAMKLTFQAPTPSTIV